ncbi:MAG TPA: DUF1569 domain-containing protein [Flavitalea sp.]|nr:DUF1569 domain-containing protein [Flavitalea sp.]
MRTTADFDGICQRIKSLSPASSRLWGKMSVSQMLAHCQRPFAAALGPGDTKRGIASYLFGPMAKRSFMGANEFRKNLPTAPAFKITHEPGFEEERAKLLDNVHQFLMIDKAKLSARVHPFFGPMSGSEWYELMYKHLDHHLKQFGV